MTSEDVVPDKPPIGNDIVAAMREFRLSKNAMAFEFRRTHTKLVGKSHEWPARFTSVAWCRPVCKHVHSNRVVRLRDRLVQQFGVIAKKYKKDTVLFFLTTHFV